MLSCINVIRPMPGLPVRERSLSGPFQQADAGRLIQGVEEAGEQRGVMFWLKGGHFLSWLGYLEVYPGQSTCVGLLPILWEPKWRAALTGSRKMESELCLPKNH
jgi:hypothetical protein